MIGQMKTVIFLTAGELPVLRTLQVSQVIENIMEAKDHGMKCSYYAFIPFTTHIKYILKHRKSAVKDFIGYIKGRGIKTKYSYSFLNIESLLTFFFRKLLVKFEARKLRKYILSFGEGEYLLQCRSYYAADIGCQVKRSLGKDGLKLKVAFDMRSLLPPEFSYSSPLFSGYLFRESKKWERKIINESDISFMTTKRAVRQLRKDHGNDIRIGYIPLSGFRKRDVKTLSMKERWNNKRIGYVGQLGKWHTATSLNMMFSFFDNCLDNYKKIVVAERTKKYATSIEDVEFLSTDYEFISDIYSSMLAILIPGDLFETGNPYKLLQMDMNLFSTKAAEALTCGVPLIANAKLGELTDFIRENDCGIIMEYDIESNKMKALNIDSEEIGNFDYWARISDNAKKAGQMFLRESVLARHMEYWNKI
jgi:glycosyltransferase involved in cell wall biosynthesis